mmetsp:Transcript_26046/g.54975  ORF Transcript_26046/g.54975 Transcript_26046/m.54975 type:complete len:133 (-) Transcript_26046:34-432(-)
MFQSSSQESNFFLSSDVQPYNNHEPYETHAQDEKRPRADADDVICAFGGIPREARGKRREIIGVPETREVMLVLHIVRRGVRFGRKMRLVVLLERMRHLNLRKESGLASVYDLVLHRSNNLYFLLLLTMMAC